MTLTNNKYNDISIIIIVDKCKNIFFLIDVALRGDHNIKVKIIEIA